MATPGENRAKCFDDFDRNQREVTTLMHSLRDARSLEEKVAILTLVVAIQGSINTDIIGYAAYGFSALNGQITEALGILAK